MKKKVQSDKFKTKHMKKNVRASPARKDHHLAQVRSQFTREYIKINVQICPYLLCIVVQQVIPQNTQKYLKFYTPAQPLNIPIVHFVLGLFNDRCGVHWSNFHHRTQIPVSRKYSLVFNFQDVKNSIRIVYW